MDIGSIKRFIKTPTAKLSASYLGLIMLMSLAFSGVLYQVSSQQLGRQLPPPSVYNDDARFGTAPDSRQQLRRDQINGYLQDRINEGRQAILFRLLMLNLLVLVGGAGLSYYLARRSLQPIEKAMEAQTQFVSDASHELRTPITALQTSNEVALRSKKLTLSDARELIGHNVTEAQNLKALSDALLGLLKKDEIIASAVPLQNAVNQAMNSVMPMAVEKDIAIDDKVANLRVMATAHGLGQIFTILLDNAVKYSPANTNITLTSEERSKTVVITVIDQGDGIRAGELPHIFQRFYRADKARTSSADQHGHGLGLSIAQKLVNEYGGTISASSELGKGSVFTIELPKAE